jgi:hypothetical protein
MADFASGRTEQLRVACGPAAASSSVVGCTTCFAATPNVTVPKQSDRLLQRLTLCPIYTIDKHTGSLCATPSNVVSLVTGSSQYRKYARVRRIDDITTVARSATASELTARRHAIYQQQAVNDYETFFPREPPSPFLCVPQPRVGPQAGVPIARSRCPL